MKIRISERTLRLRLNDDDVDVLKSSGSLALKMPTGPATELVFSLRLGTAWSVRHDGNIVVIAAPTTELQPWLDSSEIECEHEVSGLGLRVLIEKDIISSRRESL